jgi:hypothetical protein
MKVPSPPFQPETSEALKARFAAALEVCIPLEGDEQEAMRPCHFFDFKDGYRLNITRDRLVSGEFVIVSGGLYDGPLLPITLIAARVALHFAALSDMKYGQGEIAHAEANTVMMAFKFTS